MNKRINNEIKWLLDHEIDAQVSDEPPASRQEGLSINVYLPEYTLCFRIPKDYPFKPPSYTIKKLNGESVSYLDYYKANDPLELIALKEIKTKCMCCETVLCPHKWFPALKIHSIIDEFDDARKIKEYVLNVKVLEVLNDKMYNLYKCALPLELRFIIWQFMKPSIKYFKPTTSNN